VIARKLSGGNRTEAGAETHAVLGNPLKPPFPDGIEVAYFALGCFWGAERLFWELDGVYTTDPRVVEEARRLDRVTFEEMLEMASLGSKVLQIRSVEFAGKYQVKTRVLSSLKSLLETRKGGPWPNEIKLDSWE